MEEVWGYDFMGDSNIIEVDIRHLRLKLETEGEKRLIQTVPGIGYVLKDECLSRNASGTTPESLSKGYACMKVGIFWGHVDAP